MTVPESGKPEPSADASADDIAADIEATRAELGQTVEALTAKLDVKVQARHKVDDTKKLIASKAQPVPVAALALVAVLVGVVIWRRRR